MPDNDPFDDFDNDTEPSDERYFAFFGWLSARTVDALRAARGRPERQRAALLAYYGRGHRARVTAAEMIDCLAVSTPSILDRAGYDEAEADALTALSDTITDADVAAASGASGAQA